MRWGRQRISPPTSSVEWVGVVAMLVGFVLVVVAGSLSQYGPGDIAAETSGRLQHWTTVSGVLGVMLVALGGVISVIGRRNSRR